MRWAECPSLGRPIQNRVQGAQSWDGGVEVTGKGSETWGRAEERSCPALGSSVDVLREPAEDGRWSGLAEGLGHSV